MRKIDFREIRARKLVRRLFQWPNQGMMVVSRSGEEWLVWIQFIWILILSFLIKDDLLFFFLNIL